MCGLRLLIPFTSGHFLEQNRFSSNHIELEQVSFNPLHIGALSRTRRVDSLCEIVDQEFQSPSHRGTFSNNPSKVSGELLDRVSIPSTSGQCFRLFRCSPCGSDIFCVSIPFTSGHFLEPIREKTEKRQLERFNPLHIGALSRTQVKLVLGHWVCHFVSIPFTSGHFLELWCL